MAFDELKCWQSVMWGAVPDENITDKLARDLWLEVSRLHRARIAHRSLHAGNIMVGGDGCPRLVDFSFAELAATGRQLAIDTAIR